jgi:hypothetical protein
MHSHHAVVNLSAIPIPLPTGAHRLFAALGRTRLVHATDGFWVGMVFRHDLLAPVSELLFIPLDRFEKALQCSRRVAELQGNGLRRLAV